MDKYPTGQNSDQYFIDNWRTAGSADDFLQKFNEGDDPPPEPEMSVEEFLSGIAMLNNDSLSTMNHLQSGRSERDTILDDLASDIVASC